MLSLLGLKKRQQNFIFPPVDPAVDGPDCTKDCASCSIKYPARFKVDTSRRLYGSVKAFGTHLLVATGKDDWEAHPEEESGSLMSSWDNATQHVTPKTGIIKVSASNIPITDSDGNHTAHRPHTPATVLLLPQFVFVSGVTASNVPSLVSHYVDNQSPTSPPQPPTDDGLSPAECPHDFAILLCSHKRRDARCGQSAPLLKRELDRHLRAQGLYRDWDDTRPGGCGVYFVSHVGGHKFAGNVLIYRRRQQQMIWLARIRPEHCEGVVRYTLLQGKVVHPESQLRGGWDKENNLVSW